MDATDYAILRALQSQDEPVWKSEIHKVMERQIETLPIDTVSSQTVGRRIETLRENGVVQHTVVNPEKIDRDLVVAYKVTADGKDAMAEHRESMLQEIVRDNLFADEKSLGMNREAAVALISDQFDLSDDSKQLLLDEYSVEELIAFLEMYYTENDVRTVFADGWEKLEAVVTDNEELAPLLQNRIKQLREQA